MTHPKYLIVFNVPEKYIGDRMTGVDNKGRVVSFGNRTALSVDQLFDVTGEPSEHLKRGISFDDDADLLYYDEGDEDGYIAKSDIKAIIDVDKLIGEDVDSLDNRFKIAPEDVPTHHGVQD